MSKIVVASEALASGSVTRRELARDYAKMFRNVYVRRGVELTARDKAVAAWLWSGRSAILGGSSASALLGTKFVDPTEPAVLFRANRRSPQGISVYSGALHERDVRTITGMGVTTPARTAFDIGRYQRLVVAVPRLDALFRATGCTVDDVSVVAARHPGARGIRRMLTAMDLADGGAESPPESLTRLLIVAAGLPRPVTQIPIVGDDGRALYRLDMGWREHLVAVEYDGEQHWTDPRQRTRDIERLEYLAAQGWTVIRVSWTQLRDRPQSMVYRVAKALRIAPSVQISHASLELCVQQLHAGRPTQYV